MCDDMILHSEILAMSLTCDLLLLFARDPDQGMYLLHQLSFINEPDESVTM